MKKKKYIIISIIFIVFVSVILAIYLPRKYRVPEFVLSKLDYDASDFVETYEKYSHYYDYTRVYEDDNGDLVLVLTNRQKQVFKENMLSQLDSAKYSYNKKGISLSYDKTFSNIQFECKTEKFGNEVSKTRIDSIMGIAYFYQVFDDVKLDEIRISITVTDIDTGEVIYENSLESYSE